MPENSNLWPRLRLKLVGQIVLPEGPSSLIRNHHQKQAGDRGEQPQAMLDKLVAKDVAPFEVPVLAFSGRAKGVLVETGAIRPPFHANSPRPDSRQLSPVLGRADPREGLCDGLSTRWSRRPVGPRQIGHEEGESIGLHSLHRVRADILRHRPRPPFEGRLAVVHALTAAHVSRFTFHVPRSLFRYSSYSRKTSSLGG